MPNWTSNYIEAEGDPSDIRAFLEAIKGADTVLDFDRIVPMPELVRRTGSGRCTIDGKAVDTWYVFDDGTHRLLSAEEEKQLADLGCSNWCDWACANWGTKWNAYRPSIEDETAIDFGCVRIEFDTAWDAPIPILKKIVEIFPDISFKCRWRHEDDDSYPHSLELP